MFFKGEKGVPPDYTKAEHYLRMAIDEEDAGAQLILAMVLIKRPKNGKAAKLKVRGPTRLPAHGAPRTARVRA